MSPEASEAGLKDRSTPRARCPRAQRIFKFRVTRTPDPDAAPDVPLRIPTRHPMHTGRPLRLRRCVKSCSDETYTRAHKCASQGAPICHATYPRPCLYYHRTRACPSQRPLERRVIIVFERGPTGSGWQVVIQAPSRPTTSSGILHTTVRSVSAHSGHTPGTPPRLSHPAQSAITGDTHKR